MGDSSVRFLSVVRGIPLDILHCQEGKDFTFGITIKRKIEWNRIYD